MMPLFRVVVKFIFLVNTFRPFHRYSIVKCSDLKDNFMILC